MAEDTLVFAILYQAPPLLLGLVLKVLIPQPAIRAIFVLPGTFVHELLHLVVGLMLNGKPVSISLWPRKVGHGQWVLGAVGCWRRLNLDRECRSNFDRGLVASI